MICQTKGRHEVTNYNCFWINFSKNGHNFHWPRLAQDQVVWPCHSWHQTHVHKIFPFPHLQPSSLEDNHSFTYLHITQSLVSSLITLKLVKAALEADILILIMWTDIESRWPLQPSSECGTVTGSCSDLGTLQYMYSAVCTVQYTKRGNGDFRNVLE